MSAKVNLTELLADREAGTGGEWEVGGGGTHYFNARVKDGHRVAQMAIAKMSQHAAEGQANARRIARLPDLEAAYIEAVEVVRALLHGVHGDGYVLPAGAIATARARKFLGEDQ